LIEEFLRIVGKTTVRDKVTKLVVFLTGFSAFGEEPLNLFLRGPSSIGKTYVTMQTLKFFPSYSVMLLGGLSPTALVHDYGDLVDGRTGQVIDLTQKPKKSDFKGEDGKVDEEAYKRARDDWNEMLKHAYYRVDLRRKILVFLESPHPETYMRLRPILSHDAPEVSYKFTDRPGGGPLRTMHVKLVGWPATVFCTTEERYVEDLATRSFTHTPEMSREKYQEAVRLHGRRAMYPWLFDGEGEEEARFREEVLKTVTLLQVLNRVVVPFGEKMAEVYRAHLARDMRDYVHFLGLVKALALVHVRERPILEVGDKHYIVASLDDYEVAAAIFKAVFETTRSGLSGNVMMFFDIVKEEWEKVKDERPGLTYGELVTKYNEKAVELGLKKVSKSTLYKWVQELSNLGYLDTVPNPNDRRYRYITLIENPNISGDYLNQINEEFFGEKDFYNWFEGLKNIIFPKPLLYRDWFSKEKVNLSDVLPILLGRRLGKIIFSEVETQESERKEEKEMKSVGNRQSQIILKPDVSLGLRGVSTLTEGNTVTSVTSVTSKTIRRPFEEDISLQQALDEATDILFDLTRQAGGPIPPEELRRALGWNQDFFSRVLRIALRDRVWYQTPDGRIGVSW